jgi:hypothetical protein
VPGPCQCGGCTSGANGAYTRLLHTAQADDDTAHRQLAMTEIAAIAPIAGGDGTTMADALAVPVLARLYHDPAAGG